MATELQDIVIEKLNEVEAGLEEREIALAAHLQRQTEHLRKQNEEQQRLMTHLRKQSEEQQQLRKHVNGLRRQLDELQKQLGDTS